MEKQRKREMIKKYLKKNLLNSLIFSLAAAVVVAIIASIVAMVKGYSIVKCIYNGYYSLGAFCLIFAVPQLYKRNEDSKIGQVRRLSFFGSFNDIPGKNPYAEKEMLKGLEEHRGNGFLFGICIIAFCLLVISYGVIIETLFYTFGR